MAMERIGRMISDQLSGLPENHPDRKFISELNDLTINHLESEVRRQELEAYERNVERMRMVTLERSSPSFIVESVCKVFGVTEEELKGEARKKRFVLARKAVAHLMCEYTENSLVEIAEAIGRTDHTTIVHHRDTTPGLIEKNPEFASDIRYLKKIIEARDIKIITVEPVSNGISPNGPSLSK